MYLDFKYYQTEYGGEVFESEEAFQRYARKAERRVDAYTYGKLSFAFPAAEKDAAAVKDCICELAEFLYRVNQLQAAASDSVGVVKQNRMPQKTGKCSTWPYTPSFVMAFPTYRMPMV